MSRENELFDKYMLIRQMTEAVRNKSISQAGPLGDTTRGRGRVLSLLKQRDGVSTKELATVMGIRVSSLNEVLSKMESEGLVERSASPDDRRVMLIWLTDAGKAIELPGQNMPSILFGTLDQGSQNKLSIYFEQIIASLQSELGEEGEEIREARVERNEFFEQARSQQAQSGQDAGPVASPRSAPHAPAGMPVPPPVAPMAAPPAYTPPRLG